MSSAACCAPKRSSRHARNANAARSTPRRSRKVESAAIEDAVALQKAAGLKVCTDGEFHRRHWFLDFLEKIDGVEVKGGLAVKFHNEGGDIEFSPPRFEVHGKMKRSRSLSVDDFAELKGVAARHGLTAKQPIPSPTLVHMRGGRAAIDSAVYPDMDTFVADLVAVYRAEIKALYDAGCRYLQIDETNLPFSAIRSCAATVKNIGEDPDKLPGFYVSMLNDVLKGLPADMTVVMHLCRGNHESAWVAEGGYDPVAEVLFGDLAIDGFFLEYDSPRAGSFAPLRYLSKNKTAVLGLVTTKNAGARKQGRAQAPYRRGGEDRAARSPRAVAAMRLCLDDPRQRADCR